MLIWKEDFSHRFLSGKDRKIYIEEMSTGNTCKILNRFSIVLNIFVPIILYFVFGFNLYVFGICFIVMDIFLNVFEQIFFISIPYLKFKNKTEKHIRRRIVKLKKAKNKINKTISFLRKKYCESCNKTYNPASCRKCSEMDCLINKQDELEKLISKYENDLPKTIKTDKNTKPNTKTNFTSTKDNSSSIQKEINEFPINYLKIVAEKLNEFINKQKFDFLIPLKKSINSTLEILKTKPIGKYSIPSSIYDKLDKILIVLNEFSNLDKNQQDTYVETIKKISKNTSDEFQMIISQINQMKISDSPDINKLLHELNHKEEDKNA